MIKILVRPNDRLRYLFILEPIQKSKDKLKNR